MVMNDVVDRCNAPQAVDHRRRAYTSTASYRADVERAPQEQERTFEPRGRAFNGVALPASLAVNQCRELAIRCGLQSRKTRRAHIGNFLAHPLQRA